MPAVTAAFQIASLIGSLLIVAVSIESARRWAEARPMVALPGVWAVFGVVYYAFVLAGRFTPQALLLWGAVHRLMAVVMVLGMVVTLAAIMAAPPLDDSERERDDLD